MPTAFFGKKRFGRANRSGPPPTRKQRKLNAQPPKPPINVAKNIEAAQEFVAPLLPVIEKLR